MRGIRWAIWGERGAQTVEIVAALPLLLFLALVGWQLLAVGYTGMVASAAARECARAYAVDGNGYGAAMRVIGTWSSGYRVQLLGGGDMRGCEVRLQPPAIRMPFRIPIQLPWVQVTAWMRWERRF